ncbi:hypothetical protein T484DRAFT_1864849, partial [Baffinella frigidus]
VEVRAANAHELDQGAVLATRFSPLAPPPAPYVLRVTAVRSSSLSVQWEAVTNATAISFFNLSVSGEVYTQHPWPIIAPARAVNHMSSTHTCTVYTATLKS